MMRSNGEKGFVLLTAILIMIILALVGMGAILNSSVEINISHDERMKKEALFAADSGTALVPRIIDYYMSEQPSIAGYPGNLPADLQGVMKNPNFLNAINGTAQNNDLVTNPDFQTTCGGNLVNGDIYQIARVQPTGQNIVFLTEDGVVPPVTIFYRGTCRGYAADNSFVDVEMIYKYIPTY